MNFNKLFAAAKKEGIEVCEITTSKSKSLAFSLFHGELDNYSISSTFKTSARGIYNGKLGSYTTEEDNKLTIPKVIEAIKVNSTLIEKAEKPIIFKGSKKYYKKNVFSKAIDEWSVEDKIKTLHQIENKLKSLDSRVSEVEVSYNESASEEILANSYGLNLKSKSNYFYFYGSVVVKQGEEIKSFYKLFLDSDPTKFNVDEFSKKIVDGAIALLDSKPIKNKVYKAVLNQDSVSSLLNALLSNLSSEEIQKHSSLLEKKLETQVFSKKLSVAEKRLNKNCFFQYFDDEGVAIVDKKVIEKGVIKTYFYNLETAAKDNVETTGNARKMGSKIGIGFGSIVVKPGKSSLEDLFAKIGDGVYITSLSGLHAGLDSQSGDFSLQAEGFSVVDGKKSDPLPLITVAGNLYTLFNDIIAIGNNSELLLDSTTTPSIAFKHIKVSS